MTKSMNLTIGCVIVLSTSRGQPPLDVFQTVSGMVLDMLSSKKEGINNYSGRRTGEIITVAVRKKNTKLSFIRSHGVTHGLSRRQNILR
ncbi:MAG: hypothetical protein WBZ36_10175 [Candidatus Nitrosopolaris sp.]